MSAKPDRVINDLPVAKSQKIQRGFHDWLCEDANGRLFTPSQFGSPQKKVAQWCLEVAAKPIRITLRIHNAGDAIACLTRRRITFERVPMHTWFFDDPDENETGARHQHPAAVRNLERMMPGALWARLYGVSESCARETIVRHGFKQLPKVEHAQPKRHRRNPIGSRRDRDA